MISLIAGNFFPATAPGTAVMLPPSQEGGGPAAGVCCTSREGMAIPSEPGAPPGTWGMVPPCGRGGDYVANGCSIRAGEDPNPYQGVCAIVCGRGNHHLYTGAAPSVTCCGIPANLMAHPFRTIHPSPGTRCCTRSGPVIHSHNMQQADGLPGTGTSSPGKSPVVFPDSAVRSSNMKHGIFYMAASLSPVNGRKSDHKGLPDFK